MTDSTPATAASADTSAMKKAEHGPEFKHKCPACGSTDVRELFRVEAMEWGSLGPETDLCVMACRDCRAEWDAEK